MKRQPKWEPKVFQHTADSKDNDLLSSFSYSFQELHSEHIVATNRLIFKTFLKL